MTKIDDTTDETTVISAKIAITVKRALQIKAAELGVYDYEIVEDSLRAFLKLPKRKVEV